ncbi:MAG TPA: hypothetical protein HA224_00585 [Nanoarchaeota archaeon]|nr:hypothetical protein [Nanoarchaeota archaeon]
MDPLEKLGDQALELLIGEKVTMRNPGQNAFVSGVLVPPIEDSSQYGVALRHQHSNAISVHLIPRIIKELKTTDGYVIIADWDSASPDSLVTYSLPDLRAATLDIRLRKQGL